MPRIWFRTAIVLGVVPLALTFSTDSVEAQRRGGNSDTGWKFMSEKYDKDNDGKITSEEYTRSADAFKTLDRDSDGAITKADWSVSSGKRRARGDAPKVGDTAPDFKLTMVKDAETETTLSSFAGKKPVALIFGSCT